MSYTLPKEINPWRLAQNGLQLAGLLPLSAMARLTEVLQIDDGQVAVAMTFGIDEMGISYMRGNFTTSVSMLCDRCMQPMQLAIDAHCLLALLHDEQAATHLAEKYEPWVLEGVDTVTFKHNG